MISIKNLVEFKDTFSAGFPFNHVIIDNFFTPEFAKSLEKEFPPYESEDWHYYCNPLENKKTLNNWNIFGSQTYKCFTYLCSDEFVNTLSGMVGVRLFPDIGLHGGGLHIHESGGNLNPHLDYNIHPKLGLQRKLNLLVYLSESLRPEFGGQLGFWEHDSLENQPGKLVKEIDPIFNRCVIFDTTQNSWHGISRVLKMQQNVFRKSIAVYYLCQPEEGATARYKALFAPRDDQKHCAEIKSLIEKRSSLCSSSSVYRTC